VISGPRRVLLVDPDDSGALATRLRTHLPDHEVVTARTSGDAVTVLGRDAIAALVVDVRESADAPALLSHVRSSFPNLPVVIIGDGPADDVRSRLPALGLLRIVEHPADAAVVAQHVRGSRAESVRGRLVDIHLSTVVQLMRGERATGCLLVHTNHRRGRLHFLDGTLMDAYDFDADVAGEAAARNLLLLDVVTVEFERSLHNHARRIATSLDRLLLEVATAADERATVDGTDP
jgi:hypothetical protein